jgi:hypothetical protein
MCIVGPLINANIVNIHTHAGAHHHLSRSAIKAMRAENWGFTAIAPAAAKVAELVFYGFFLYTSLCCLPSRQLAACVLSIHAMWCSHQW